MPPFGLVELRGTRQRLEHAGGGAGDPATLEPGVVLHAQTGERRDRAAPQSRDPAGPGARQTDLVGRGGPIEVIRIGDRVVFEADEEHWHGAAADRLMVHPAINEGLASGR